MNKPVTLIIMNFKRIFQNTNWSYYYGYGSQRTRSRNTVVFAANRIRENVESTVSQSLKKLCDVAIVIIDITYCTKQLNTSRQTVHDLKLSR